MSDRPQIKLQLQTDGLKVTWGPKHGPWAKSSEASNFTDVVIKEWWLFVGTKPSPGQPHEGPQNEIISQSVGKDTEMIIPRFLLPKHKQVLAQVIGYFDTMNEHDEPIVEGIYSDVAHQVMD